MAAVLYCTLFTACGAEKSTATPGALRASTLAALGGDANATQCPYGGNLLNYGIDKNGNGVLDPSEVAGAFPVCDGAPTGTGGSGGTTVVVDSNDVIVPIILSTAIDPSYGGSFADPNGYLWSYTNASENLYTSNANYLVQGATRLQNAWYQSSDCTGEAYVAADLRQSIAQRRSLSLELTTGENTYAYPPEAWPSSPMQFNSSKNASGTCAPPYDANGVYTVPVSMLVPASLPPMPGTPPYRISINP